MYKRLPSYLLLSISILLTACSKHNYRGPTATYKDESSATVSVTVDPIATKGKKAGEIKDRKIVTEVAQEGPPTGKEFTTQLQNVARQNLTTQKPTQEKTASITQNTYRHHLAEKQQEEAVSTIQISNNAIVASTCGAYWLVKNYKPITEEVSSTATEKAEEQKVHTTKVPNTTNELKENTQLRLNRKKK